MATVAACPLWLFLATSVAVATAASQYEKSPRQILGWQTFAWASQWSGKWGSRTYLTSRGRCCCYHGFLHVHFDKVKTDNKISSKILKGFSFSEVNYCYNFRSKLWLWPVAKILMSFSVSVLHEWPVSQVLKQPFWSYNSCFYSTNGGYYLKKAFYLVFTS